jgi:hypothetical protein
LPVHLGAPANDHEQRLGPAGQPTSTNAFLNGNSYHAPDHSRFSGMNVIDMRMHMNFGDALNAFGNGKDSDDSYNDATYNVVYVDSHDYGPNKSGERYAGGTDAWAENMSLMWTFRGIPTLYYGSEVEFQKGRKIDCGPSCPLSTTGRAYFGDHLAGDVKASDFSVVESASGAALEAALAGGVTFRDAHHQDFVQGNIKARQRMIAQYAVAGAHDGLVVGTDHAAEAVSGFFTKYGDGAADVVPLTGLTKRRVRAVAEALGAPSELVWKTPTADLETLDPGKPDEDALGVTYDDIDDFLEGKPVGEAAFASIVRRYELTDHKRRLPIAP